MAKTNIVNTSASITTLPSQRTGPEILGSEINQVPDNNNWNPFAQALAANSAANSGEGAFRSNKGEFGSDNIDPSSASTEKERKALEIAARAEQHKFRITSEERRQQTVFDQEKQQTSLDIQKARESLLEIAKNRKDIATNSHEAVRDAKLSTYAPKSLDGAPGITNFLSKIALAIGLKPHRSDNWLAIAKTKRRKRGPGAAIARAGHGHLETEAVLTEINNLDRASGE
ncbi:hypothetical protein KKD03_05070 [Patescibacteria group bacterium]|nr:hypothetical protein [Patescibacteria group bacterium]